MALRQLGVSITAYTSQVGSIALEKDYHLYDLNTIEDNPVRCPDQAKAKEMEDLIAQVKADGDTIGGIITCVIKGCPVGLGEPEFDKLHAQLGAAMLGINAVKGFEYGEGFAGVSAREANRMTSSFLKPRIWVLLMMQQTIRTLQLASRPRAIIAVASRED